MSRQHRFTSVSLLLAAAALSACAAPLQSVSQGSAQDGDMAFEAPGAPEERSASMRMRADSGSLTVPGEAAMDSLVMAGPPVQGSPSDRRVIKNGELTLEVDNVPASVSRVSREAAALGGYVLETTTEYREYGHGGATVRIAVPAERFEAAMENLRGLAARVVNDSTTGTDVTQEYVDLESQIANLEATQVRVRQFLDQAQNVEEALAVQARLTEIEGQLARLKGRLQYLAELTAFSNITVQLWPSPAALTPTPTATASPTPTRVPPPTWDPSGTLGDARWTLMAMVYGMGTLLIWVAVVLVPVALPFAVVAYVLRRRRPDRGD